MDTVDLGQIIAEGSEAAHLTGLTPMQLVAHRGVLLAALEVAAGHMPYGHERESAYAVIKELTANRP